MERGVIIHYVAYCSICDWMDDNGYMDKDREKTRKSAKKHVEETGHPVHIESCRIDKYL